jgi:hypothetical protein
MQLVNIMPKVPFLSVGDMIDRGSESLKILEFFMKEPNRAILGNHEHMMLDTYFGRKIYAPGIWLDYRNGGYQTLKSFAPDALMAWEYMQTERRKSFTIEELLKFIRKNRDDLFPEDVMKWLDRLPVFFRRKGLFVSHAPRNPHAKWLDLAKSKEEPMRLSGAPSNLLWNIGEPGYRKDTVQVHGHVIVKEPVFLGDEAGAYAVNIDTCRGYGSKLTGLHWPSFEVFQVTCGETGTTQNIVEKAVVI